MVQSARSTSVLNLVPISFWPAPATSWWNTSTGMPSDSRISDISARMSCVLSTGGTGKYPPLTVGRWPRLPPSSFLPEFHGASYSSILKKVPDMSVFQRTSSKMKNSGSGPK
eukprot:Amastigsp_a515981_3.p3 type:complete len:112 gc:universal Amastigsp_a515981_3:155-490(+)